MKRSLIEEKRVLAQAWVDAYPQDQGRDGHGFGFEEAWLERLLTDSPLLVSNRRYYSRSRHRDLWERTEAWIRACQEEDGLYATPEARARTLIAQGFMSISNKYREIARVPPGLSPLEAIRRKNPVFAKQEEERFEHQLRETYARVFADGEDRRELSDEEFLAFKRVCGDWTEKRCKLEQELLEQRKGTTP